ncbi:hypothetical protein B0H19DRAFT_1181217 [Mycena capillaripes]|nr:hypothetical protein B0H19DRAFT_1181217 [Mycena capillaripes]
MSSFLMLYFFMTTDSASQALRYRQSPPSLASITSSTPRYVAPSGVSKRDKGALLLGPTTVLCARSASQTCLRTPTISIEVESRRIQSCTSNPSHFAQLILNAPRASAVAFLPLFSCHPMRGWPLFVGLRYQLEKWKGREVDCKLILHGSSYVLDILRE